MAAIAATLARYCEQIITDVTHPVSGLPARKAWLPTVKEVFEACEDLAERDAQMLARERRIREQLALREELDNAPRPTLEQLKEKYGEDWGLAPRPDTKKTAAQNHAEMARQQSRVRAEYAAAGLPAPASPLALSLTARRMMADIDSERNRDLPSDQAAQ